MEKRNESEKIGKRKKKYKINTARLIYIGVMLGGNTLNVLLAG